MGKKFHFKDNSESYKHFHAKDILAKWLRPEFIDVRIEYELRINFMTRRIPDIACYNENGICAVYEVVHSNLVSREKKMFYLGFMENISLKFHVYEISAEYIMRQIKKPLLIRKTKIL